MSAEHRKTGRAGRQVREQQRECPLTRGEIRGVDGGEHRCERIGPQFGRTVGEGPDVFRETPATIAEAGGEKLLPDPRIETHRVGDGGDVGAGTVTEVGDGVDETHLRGEKRIGGDLDHLGRGEIGCHPLAPLGERLGVQQAQQGVNFGRSGAEDDTLGVQRVGDGSYFTQKFGVPREMQPVRCKTGGEPGRGTDRYGGFADHHRTRGEHRGERGERGLHLKKVGGRRILALRRPDTHKDKAAGAQLLEIRGEHETTGLDTLLQERVKHVLEERCAARAQRIKLPRIKIEGDDVKPPVRKTGSVRAAEIPATDHANRAMLERYGRRG